MKVIERENEIVCDRAGCPRQGRFRFSAGGPPEDDLVLCEECAEELRRALNQALDPKKKKTGAAAREDSAV